MLCFFAGFGQQYKVDSLNKVLENTSNDTERLRLYLLLGNACSINDNLKYGQAGLDLANALLSKKPNSEERSKLLRQKAEACEYICAYYSNVRDLPKMFKHKTICLNIYEETQDTSKINKALSDYFNFYNREGNIPKAIEYIEKGLNIFTGMNYKNGIANFTERLGILYSQADYSELAIANFNKCITMYAELKDSVSLGRMHIELGTVYSKLKNIKKAQENYLTALVIYQNKKKKNGVRWVYNSIGSMYKNIHDLDNALENYEEGLIISQQLPNKEWTRTILIDIGSIYLEKNELNKALDFYTQALNMVKTEGDRPALGMTYGYVAKAYLKQKNYTKATMYSDSSLNLLKSLGIAPFTSKAEQLAAQVDSCAGRFKEAYAHYQQYIVLYNQIKKEEINKLATREKFKIQYEDQKAKDRIEQEKKELLLNQERQRDKIILYSLTAGFVLVLALAFISYRSYRQKQRSNLELAEKNKEIEEKNKDILDSIHYAKRIQTSLLPTEKYIERVLTKDKNKDSN